MTWLFGSVLTLSVAMITVLALLAAGVFDKHDEPRLYPYGTEIPPKTKS